MKLYQQLIEWHNENQDAKFPLLDLPAIRFLSSEDDKLRYCCYTFNEDYQIRIFLFRTRSVVSVEFHILETSRFREAVSIVRQNGQIKTTLFRDLSRQKDDPSAIEALKTKFTLGLKNVLRAQGRP